MHGFFEMQFSTKLLYTIGLLRNLMCQVMHSMHEKFDWDGVGLELRIQMVCA